MREKERMNCIMIGLECTRCSFGVKPMLFPICTQLPKVKIDGRLKYASLLYQCSK